eukprot:CAMPEP_0115040698 /NCGR_PEP_ID=MMETSP0216-20121206/44982_1 /TAXON_ID=223996 /ORGANISM="Protocruzia adherens, Strain Boccale" /LENGTH=475 /DNA_ID=CAMNT_0002421985 /DNA_START=45 /DNA_END=1472 /DNA_ORIENTATION=+
MVSRNLLAIAVCLSVISLNVKAAAVKSAQTCDIDEPGWETVEFAALTGAFEDQISLSGFMRSVPVGMFATWTKEGLESPHSFAISMSDYGTCRDLSIGFLKDPQYEGFRYMTWNCGLASNYQQTAYFFGRTDKDGMNPKVLVLTSSQDNIPERFPAAFLDSQLVALASLDASVNNQIIGVDGDLTPLFQVSTVIELEITAISDYEDDQFVLSGIYNAIEGPDSRIYTGLFDSDGSLQEDNTVVIANKWATVSSLAASTQGIQVCLRGDENLWSLLIAPWDFSVFNFASLETSSLSNNHLDCMVLGNDYQASLIGSPFSNWFVSQGYSGGFKNTKPFYKDPFFSSASFCMDPEYIMTTGTFMNRDGGTAPAFVVFDLGVIDDSYTGPAEDFTVESLPATNTIDANWTLTNNISGATQAISDTNFTRTLKSTCSSVMAEEGSTSEEVPLVAGLAVLAAIAAFVAYITCCDSSSFKCF